MLMAAPSSGWCADERALGRAARTSGPPCSWRHHPQGGAQMSVLVVDVGTSSVRAAVVRPDLAIDGERSRPLLPSSPAPGLVEFDPAALAATALEGAKEALAAAGPRGR